MENTLDIFRNDAFSFTSLQRVVDSTPYIPQMLGDMGLFDDKPINTENVLIYEKDGGFKLIPTTERGTPEIEQVRRSGRLFALKTRRIAKKDSVRAGDLGPGIADMALPQNIRERNAAQLVAERTQQLKTDSEATKELHRLGALQGKILDVSYDADGEVSIDVVGNFFDEFNVPQPPVVDIDFTSPALDERNARMFFQENVVVPIQTSLKARWSPNVEIHALVGDDYWGQLNRNAAFYRLYELMLQGRQLAMAANPLARTNNWETVYFGGIYWTNYRGSTDGEIGVPSQDAIFFPKGARDVFNVYWAPGETMNDITGKGRPEYLYIQPDTRTQIAEFVDIHHRSYPLYACIYPKALMRSTLD